jgi:hypothetical protein
VEFSQNQGRARSCKVNAQERAASGQSAATEPSEFEARDRFARNLRDRMRVSIREFLGNLLVNAVVVSFKIDKSQTMSKSNAVRIDICRSSFDADGNPAEGPLPDLNNTLAVFRSCVLSAVLFFSI